MGQAELKEFRFPTGGIADFYLEEHEKEALFKKKAEENFGNSGIANFDNVATRMASYGRYGDDKLVHAETGELVVPKALIENNPELRDSIFGHLKDMGIEDPERYVVGSRANSINPDTGLPEFFLKDIFDKVGDVIRKVAKPVLTVAGAVILAPFVGPTAGASIGAGIGGLIQGESFEEAMGSALTAGATATIGSGIAGMFGGGGFMQGVEQGFSKVGTQGFGFDTIKDNFGEVFSMDRFGADTKTGSGFQDTLQKGKELLTGKAPTAESLGAAKSTAYDTAYKTVLDKTKEEALAKAAGTKAMEGITMKSLQPSLLRKYGPSVALAATAGGFFDKPPQEEFEDPDTGQDLIDADPNKYLVQNTQIQGTTPPYMVPTQFPFMPQPSPPVTFAAKGGDVFPRRNGGIGPEEGTPGEDSVRAMLMPGEFVMTTNAVKGAGGGDLNRGINNMYSMMRNFEAKARA
jgi:hypothetical protein